MKKHEAGVEKWSELEIVFHVLVFALMVSLPFQAIWELIHWLKFGEWEHYSVSHFLTVEMILRLYEMNWLGAQKLLILASHIWVSIPLAAVGTLASLKLRGFK